MISTHNDIYTYNDVDYSTLCIGLFKAWDWAPLLFYNSVFNIVKSLTNRWNVTYSLFYEPLANYLLAR